MDRIVQLVSCSGCGRPLPLWPGVTHGERGPVCDRCAVALVMITGHTRAVLERYDRQVAWAAIGGAVALLFEIIFLVA
jgi:hypothetical protein